MFGQHIYLRDVVTLQLDEGTCTGCGTCLSVCPHDVLAQDNGKVHIQSRDACMECGACAMNCPVEAITVTTGVGCAMAVINSALGRQATSCCCVIEEPQASAGCTEDAAVQGGGCCG